MDPKAIDRGKVQPAGEAANLDGNFHTKTPRSAEQALLAGQGRVQTAGLQRRQPSQAELQQGFNDGIQAAVEAISKFDTSLTATLDKTLDASNPRVRFEVVPDVNKVANELGMRGFKGDSFTQTREVRGPDGKVKSRSYVIYINGDTVMQPGKAALAIDHELHHIKRAEEGRRASSYDAEEAGAYGESIPGAKKILHGLQEMAKHLSPQQAGPFHRAIAALQAGIAQDEKDRMIFEQRAKVPTHTAGK